MLLAFASRRSGHVTHLVPFYIRDAEGGGAKAKFIAHVPRPGGAATGEQLLRQLRPSAVDVDNGAELTTDEPAASAAPQAVATEGAPLREQTQTLVHCLAMHFSARLVTAACVLVRLAQLEPELETSMDAAERLLLSWCSSFEVLRQEAMPNAPLSVHPDAPRAMRSAAAPPEAPTMELLLAAANDPDTCLAPFLARVRGAAGASGGAASWAAVDGAAGGAAGGAAAGAGSAAGGAVGGAAAGAGSAGAGSGSGDGSDDGRGVRRSRVALGPSGLSDEHVGVRLRAARTSAMALEEAAAAADAFERTCSEADLLLFHVLEQILVPRAATAVLAGVFGHRDRFRGGEKDNSNMENKTVCPVGPVVPELTLEHAMSCTTLPPLGALVMPRFRRATLALFGIIEFHVLGDVMHCSVDATEWWSAQQAAHRVQPPDAAELQLRGAWDEAGGFTPRGLAITDWWDTYDREAQRRYRQRQRARASGRTVRGGPVLGHSGRYGGCGPGWAARGRGGAAGGGSAGGRGGVARGAAGGGAAGGPRGGVARSAVVGARGGACGGGTPTGGGGGSSASHAAPGTAGLEGARSPSVQSACSSLGSAGSVGSAGAAAAAPLRNGKQKMTQAEAEAADGRPADGRFAMLMERQAMQAAARGRSQTAQDFRDAAQAERQRIAQDEAAQQPAARTRADVERRAALAAEQIVADAEERARRGLAPRPFPLHPGG